MYWIIIATRLIFVSLRKQGRNVNCSRLLLLTRTCRRQDLFLPCDMGWRCTCVNAGYEDGLDVPILDRSGVIIVKTVFFSRPFNVCWASSIWGAVELSSFGFRSPVIFSGCRKLSPSAYSSVVATQSRTPVISSVSRNLSWFCTWVEVKVVVILPRFLLHEIVAWSRYSAINPLVVQMMGGLSMLVGDHVVDTVWITSFYANLWTYRVSQN